MTSLLTEYSAMPRRTDTLAQHKADALDRFGQMMLADNSAGVIRLLVDLVNFKHFRNEHIPCLRDRSGAQLRALQTLREHCDGELQYQSMVALARNRGTGGLLRDLPETLRQYIDTGLSWDQKVELWGKLSQGAQQFLVNAGVAPPSDVDLGSYMGDPNLLPADGYEMVSLHGYAAGYGTVLIHALPLPVTRQPDTTPIRLASFDPNQLTLDRLLTHRPQCIVDGVSIARMNLQDQGIRNFIATHFRNYHRGDSLSKVQAHILSQVGPAIVYTFMRTDVRLTAMHSPALPSNATPGSKTGGSAPGSTHNTATTDFTAEAIMEKVREEITVHGPGTCAIISHEDLNFAESFDQADFFPEVHIAS